MPAFLSDDRKPIRYIVTIARPHCPLEFQGPALANRLYTSKEIEGKIQILPHGVAQWTANRTRVVYPWHDVVQIEEVFE